MKLQLTMMKKDEGEVYTGVEVIVGPGMSTFQQDLDALKLFMERMWDAMQMVRAQELSLPCGLSLPKEVGMRAVAVPFPVTEVQIIEVQ